MCGIHDKEEDLVVITNRSFSIFQLFLISVHADAHTIHGQTSCRRETIVIHCRVITRAMEEGV